MTTLEQTTNMAASSAQEPRRGSTPSRRWRCSATRSATSTRRATRGTGTVAEGRSSRAPARRSRRRHRRHRPVERQRGLLSPSRSAERHDPRHSQSRDRPPARRPAGGAGARHGARYVDEPDGSRHGTVVRRGAGQAQTREPPTFSRHALERLQQRGIDLGEQTIQRLTGGVARAADKGSRDSVIFVDGTAFVVSVTNNTVITAVAIRAHARARVHQHRQRRDRMTTAATQRHRLDLFEEAAKGRDVPMMRGMYAAISGLKAHQTMLDVTANNLANVNTIGYKAQRTTFVDELSQVIRGASGPDGEQRRHEPAAGRPRRPGRLDRQPDGPRLRAVDRQPARPRDPGRRLLPRRQRHEHHAAGDPVITNRRSSTRAPATSRPTRSATSPPRAASTCSATSATPPAPRDELSRITPANGPTTTSTIPPGSTDIAVGQDGRRHLRRPERPNATCQQR